MFGKLNAAIHELNQNAAKLRVNGSFSRLTSQAGVDKHPPLCADRVDLLERSGELDPMPFVPSATRTVLESPHLLFPTAVKHIPGSRASREANHGDRVTLTLRLLRANKLRLVKRAMGSADTFCVGKRGGEKLREIWNGAQLTDAALPSAKPPLQASPASLATLEATEDRPVWLSCRDGRCFFDQLRAPDLLRPFLGRPRVSLKDLQCPPPCESGANAAPGLSEIELATFLLDGPCDPDDAWVIPVQNTWPMGFGWSSYIAQATMVGTCMSAGFKADSFLSDERLLLPGSDSALAVATDDCNFFLRCSDAEAALIDECPLAGLDREWERINLQPHPDKRISMQKEGRVLGFELRQGCRLQSRGGKTWSLLEAVLDLMSHRMSSPRQLSVLNGHLQWQNLINRFLYSCTDHVYAFLRRQPEWQPTFVDDDVLSEILLNVSLFAYWSADLARPWWPFIPATDASPAFGFGYSCARASPELTRALAAVTAEHDHYVRLTHCDGDPVVVERAGVEFRLPLTMDDFTTCFSVKAQKVDHSGAMELEAVRLALLRITRTARTHGCRGAILVDARAVGLALQKGRSSAKTLRRGVSSVGALALACDLKLSFPYVPSESNAADYPSRGVVKKRHIKLKKPPPLSSLELRIRAYRKASRRWRQVGTSVF